MATGWGGATTTSTEFADSLTWAGPATAGSDTVGYVAVAASTFGDRNISGVTWGGDAMTLVESIDDGFFGLFLYQKAAPASGGSVVVTNAAFGPMTAAAFYLTGNEQVTPATGPQEDTDYAGTSLSVTVASVADALVLGIFGFNKPIRTVTQGVGQTERVNVSHGTDSNHLQVVVSTEAGSAEVITSASFDNPEGNNGYLIGVSANPSVAAVALGGAGATLRRNRWLAA